MSLLLIGTLAAEENPIPNDKGFCYFLSCAIWTIVTMVIMITVAEMSAQNSWNDGATFTNCTGLNTYITTSRCGKGGSNTCYEGYINVLIKICNCSSNIYICSYKSRDQTVASLNTYKMNQTYGCYYNPNSYQVVRFNKYPTDNVIRNTLMVYGIITAVLIILCLLWHFFC